MASEAAVQLQKTTLHIATGTAHDHPQSQQQAEQQQQQQQQQNSPTFSDSSSQLSSPLSRSPSPPSSIAGFKRLYSSTASYPSPPPSQDESGGPPSPDENTTLSFDGSAPTTHSRRNTDDGGSAAAPPPKRRRVSTRGPRDTKRLNISDLSGCYSDADREQLTRLVHDLKTRQKIVVIAGAGISVSAGIPDFRSSTGLFKSLRSEHKLKSSGKHLFDASVYRDAESTSSFHQMVRSLSTMTESADPTPFHHMLARLAQEGRLLRLYTQNVDGIDTSLAPLATQVPLPRKGPWPKTIQVHGGLKHMTCTKCHALSDFQAELFDGPVPPECSTCLQMDQVRTEVAGKRSHGVGKLRPRMVLYNEHNPDDESIGAVTKADMRTRPDAVIVVGTSLKIPGVKRIVKEMCSIVRDRRDGLTVWINNDPEPSGKDFENSWDLIVKGSCDDVARHAQLKRWDDPSVDDDEIEGEQIEEVTEAQIKDAKERGAMAKVVIDASPSKAFKFKTVMGEDELPTPIDSPRLATATAAAFMADGRRMDISGTAAASSDYLSSPPPSVGKFTFKSETRVDLSLRNDEQMGNADKKSITAAVGPDGKKKRGPRGPYKKRNKAENGGGGDVGIAGAASDKSKAASKAKAKPAASSANPTLQKKGATVGGIKAQTGPKKISLVFKASKAVTGMDSSKGKGKDAKNEVKQDADEDMIKVSPSKLTLSYKPIPPSTPQKKQQQQQQMYAPISRNLARPKTPTPQRLCTPSNSHVHQCSPSHAQSPIRFPNLAKKIAAAPAL